MRIHHGLVGLLLACVPSASFAQPRQQIAGIYSDLSYNQESGDLGGTEIFVVLGGGPDVHYFAFVQEAEGQPLDPVIAPVILKGEKATIRARFADYTLLFEGKFSKTSFDGTLTVSSKSGKKSASSSEPFHLKRQKSYWE